MKRLLKILAAMSVCAALCLSVAAAEPGETNAAPEDPRTAAPVRVWGKVSPWDVEGCVFLSNSNEEDPYREVVVHLGEAPVVDAATGLPLDVESIQEGDTLYAWIGPMATMSLPPQVFAEVVVGNIPADAAAPEYLEIAGMPVKGGDGVTTFPTVGGGTLAVTDKTAYSPWLTRQMVQMESLTPGSKVLVWKNGEAAEKVLLFAYDYQGWLGLNAAGDGDVLGVVNGVFDGETPNAMESGRRMVLPLLPVRAVAEAAGYDVRWDKELKAAVVSLNGETVLSAKPGESVIQTAESESGIASPCLLENGVTYLPAADLAYWLNLFLTTAV